MEDITRNTGAPIEQINNNSRVWNPNTLKWITIFLSGITGIILYIINYYRLDHPNKKQKLLLGILFFILLTIVVIALPNFNSVRYVFFGINIALAIYYSADQKNYFTQHIKDGGRKASAWSAIGLSILFLVTYLFIVAILIYVVDLILSSVIYKLF